MVLGLGDKAGKGNKMQTPISTRPGGLVEVFFPGDEGGLSSWGTGRSLSSWRAGGGLFQSQGLGLSIEVHTQPTQPREENVKHAAFLDGFLHHQPVLVQLVGSRQVGACGGDLI